MANTIGTWGKELAEVWTNYLPPCRVSCSELGIYTQYLRILQQQFNCQKLNLLILGSTSEFRDWGHEENLNVTVIDYSKGYNQEIAKQMKYKNVNEIFVNKKWQDLDVSAQFHMVAATPVMELSDPVFLA